jgi:hypothetical protein
VTKVSKVFKGILVEDSLENYLNKVNVSICQLLFFLDIADIAIVKFFRQQPYKKIVLSEEEA